MYETEERADVGNACAQRQLNEEVREKQSVERSRGLSTTGPKRPRKTAALEERLWTTRPGMPVTTSHGDLLPVANVSDSRVVRLRLGRASGRGPSCFVSGLNHNRFDRAGHAAAGAPAASNLLQLVSTSGTARPLDDYYR